MDKTSYIIENPVLLDKAVGEIQKKLLDGIPWLNTAFGLAQRTTKIINNVEYVIPTVYMGKRGYMEVSPDQDLGNYCFFLLDDPSEIELSQYHGSVSVDCSIIFWFDFGKVFNRRDYRNLEQIKLDIFKALKDSYTDQGSFTIENLYEQSANIYKEFTIKESDNQYHMHPFGGIRIDGTLTIKQLCF